MLISPATGKIIHHKNCTYCELKIEVGSKKKGRVYTTELCDADLGKLPEGRYCDSYIQKLCDCDDCNNGRHSFQLVQTIDKESV